MYTEKQRVEFVDKVTERDMINMLEAWEMLAELESWDPVNMSDRIRKRFGYGQLRPACSHNRAGSYMPDPISRILFSSFFQRRHGLYYAKPTRIRSGWPGQGLATLIWSESKLVCRNYRARLLARRNRPATSFPFSDSFAFFHRRPG